jgi:hypothetical protein
VRRAAAQVRAGPGWRGPGRAGAGPEHRAPNSYRAGSFFPDRTAAEPGPRHARSERHGARPPDRVARDRPSAAYRQEACRGREAGITPGPAQRRGQGLQRGAERPGARAQHGAGRHTPPSGRIWQRDMRGTAGGRATPTAPCQVLAASFLKIQRPDCMRMPRQGSLSIRLSSLLELGPVLPAVQCGLSPGSRRRSREGHRGHHRERPDPRDTAPRDRRRTPNRARVLCLSFPGKGHHRTPSSGSAQPRHTRPASLFASRRSSRRRHSAPPSESASPSSCCRQHRARSATSWRC